MAAAPFCSSVSVILHYIPTLSVIRNGRRISGRYEGRLRRLCSASLEQPVILTSESIGLSTLLLETVVFVWGRELCDDVAAEWR